MKYTLHVVSHDLPLYEMLNQFQTGSGVCSLSLLPNISIVKPLQSLNMAGKARQAQSAMLYVLQLA